MGSRSVHLNTASTQQLPRSGAICSYISNIYTRYDRALFWNDNPRSILITTIIKAPRIGPVPVEHFGWNLLSNLNSHQKFAI